MYRAHAGWLTTALLLTSCDDGSQQQPRDTSAVDTTAEDTAVADSPEELPPPQAPLTLAAGTTTLTLDPAALSLQLTRDGDTRLLWDSDAFELGVVNTYSDNAHYNVWGFKQQNLVTYPSPLEAWLPLSRISYTDGEARPLELTLHFDRDVTATLTLELSSEHALHAELVPANTDALKVAYVRLRPTVDVNEGFYGLGETFDHVNHRGFLRAMQLEVDAIESAYNEAHVPVPFVIGTRGWGLFVESFHPGVFDVAHTADDRLDVLYGLGPDAEQGLRFHLFVDDHPLDMTRHYYDVTALPLLPARWAVGPWIWRDENDDQAQVLNDIQQIRDLDLATSGMWIDRPYATSVNTFDFKPSQFPDPQIMIDAMHAAGLRVALWHTPYLDESSDATAAQRAEAESRGFYPPVTGSLFNKWGKPIDLTHPEAYDWWQAQIRTYTDMGIEGFKLDYGEDIAPGSLGARNRWLFDNGEDERTMHSRFQLFYHRVYAETLPERGGFLLCRGGTFGDQAHVSVIWPGDLDADFSLHREQRDGYVAVGGLPAAMIASIGLGPSGFPFYGSDTGGYRHSPPDKETFVRWFEHTALSSVMQVGTSTNDVAWEFDADNGFDQESLDLYRIYARLHARLFPYTWTFAEAIAETGHPIQRPFGLVYPEYGEHPWDQYMYGDDLLVAPVVERDARSRSVYFPEGRWIDWWTGEVLEGPNRHTVDAPLDTLPLFIREGALIPMLRPTIDTLASATDPEVDSFVTNGPGRLYVRVMLGPARSLTLYDGTVLSQTSTELTLEAGSEYTEGARFEVLGAVNNPTDVRLDDAPLTEVASLEELDTVESGYLVDSAGTLWIQVGPGSHTVTFTP